MQRESSSGIGRTRGCGILMRGRIAGARAAGRCIAMLAAVAMASALCMHASAASAMADDGGGDERRSTIEYTIIFDGGGGAGSMEPYRVSVREGDPQEAELPANGFVREGYAFDGWRVRVPPFTRLSSVKVPDKQHLEDLAWDDASAAALQDGWAGPMTLQSFADEDDRIELVATWRDDSGNAAVSDDMALGGGISVMTSSTTVKPLYLYMNGVHGYLTTESSAPSGYWNSGQIATVPTYSTNPVYALQNPNVTRQWLFTMDVDEYNSIANAGWTRRGVVFYADDGKGIMIHRFRYTGGGGGHTWSTSESIAGSYALEGEYLYGCKFYNVAYEGGGATGGSTGSQRMQYGISYQLAQNGFTRDGYHFTGWLCSNGAWYSAGQNVVNLTSVSEETLTMTAQWAPDYYYQHYNANGGEGAMGDSRVSVGSAWAAPYCPFTRAGYEFAGWCTAADGSGAWYQPGGTFVPSADMAFFAQWRKRQLSFSVPTVLDMYLQPDGAVGGAAAQACTLANTGTTELELQGMRVDEGSLAFAGSPSWGAACVRLRSDRLGGIPLDEYVGDDFRAVGSGADVRIPMGGQLDVGAIEGECGALMLDLTGAVDAGSILWKIGAVPSSVCYDANNGSGSQYRQQANTGDKVGAASCMFSGGAAFRGWNTAADGSGAWYSPGQLFVVDGHMTLYAQWG